MAQVTAFLSYTRTDDEYFGGYITSFRKVLESAVHVVSGDKGFRVFQDVDGIVLGENWQKKLSAAIETSSFLIPMLTPLFFSSEPCRGELTEFLDHERGLSREDLILPIYFFTTPKLQKDDERAMDVLATELSKRQMFDWRERADLPLSDPAARRAIVELATQIAARIPDAPELTSASVPAGRAVLASSPASTIATADAGITELSRREALPSRSILWVDDNPDNNVWERRALASYGYEFELASSTAEATQILQGGRVFSAIVSDMGRSESSRAGMLLLDEIRGRGISAPFFIYTTRSIAGKFSEKFGVSGGQGITGDPDDLVRMVVSETRAKVAEIQRVPRE